MPFVFDLEDTSGRPRKRPRLPVDITMARRRWEEAEEVQASSKHTTRADTGPLIHENGSFIQKAETRTSDREELIQCIKRGERPTWVPKPGLESICTQTEFEQ